MKAKKIIPSKFPFYVCPIRDQQSNLTKRLYAFQSIDEAFYFASMFDGEVSFHDFAIIYVTF